MIDYKIKKGTMQGKYFLVYICEKKDLVNKISYAIMDFMDMYEKKMRPIQEFDNNLKQSKIAAEKPEGESNGDV